MRWRADLQRLRARLWGRQSTLTDSQADILRALAGGHHLKAHRFMNGTKTHRMHDADGNVVSTVTAADVAALEFGGHIAGNMKFPAAVYMLTESGHRLASRISTSSGEPLTSRMPQRATERSD